VRRSRLHRFDDDLNLTAAVAETRVFKESKSEELPLSKRTAIGR